MPHGLVTGLRGAWNWRDYATAIGGLAAGAGLVALAVLLFAASPGTPQPPAAGPSLAPPGTHLSSRPAATPGGHAQLSPEPGQGAHLVSAQNPSGKSGTSRGSSPAGSPPAPGRTPFPPGRTPPPSPSPSPPPPPPSSQPPSPGSVVSVDLACATQPLVNLKIAPLAEVCAG